MIDEDLDKDGFREIFIAHGSNPSPNYISVFEHNASNFLNFTHIVEFSFIIGSMCKADDIDQNGKKN